MIISEYVRTTISNNGSYYETLGYGRCKQGDVLDVKLEHLPSNSNKKVKCACDQCGEIFERSFQMIKRTEKILEKHFCKVCSYEYRRQVIDYSAIALSNSKRIGESHPNWNPNKTLYAEYCRLVDLETRKQPLHILENSNKLRGRCGVQGAYQLDHILSKKYGFENNISPEIIGNINNLRFIPWKENRSKWF